MNKKKTTIRCPQCNAEVSPSDEFCSECGKLLLLDENYDAVSDEQEEEAD